MVSWAVLIFLDIDGVLRRIGDPLDVLDSNCLALFEQVVRDNPQARIVISSSWRLFYSLADIRALFAADIGPRVVGQTPWLEDQPRANRFDEVSAYLGGLIEPVPWVAVDDDVNGYPASAIGNKLVITEGTTGFDGEAAQRLHRLLRSCP